MHKSLTTDMTFLHRFNSHLEKIPKTAVFAIAVLITGCITGLDWVTGDKIAFSIFYLVPIGFTAWYGSRTKGIILSAGCAIAWLSLDIITGHENYGIIITLWNALVRAVSLGITSVLISVWHKKYKNELGPTVIKASSVLPISTLMILKK
jgi:hypothetical protein